MGLVDTEAIVLRTYKLAEADKIVLCLTKDYGIVRGVARGARRLKSKFGASLEPFTLVALTYFEKEGRELVSISQAEILRSYFQLARQPETVAGLEYMCELAIEFAPPHQADERLFRMVRACVEALSEDASKLHSIVRYYETWMLKLSGFWPDVRVCGNCRRRQTGEQRIYLTTEGAPLCAECAGGAGISLSTRLQTQLRNIQALSPAQWAQAQGQHAPGANDELTRLTERLIEKALERKPRGRASFGTQVS
ncbi:MAG TPA: DNA repair protein RecO [Pyrinomonadaceae bacterium]|nr:DNA repair protein RecO [Pyrinomonadaceae bacterium]